MAASPILNVPSPGYPRPFAQALAAASASFLALQAKGPGTPATHHTSVWTTHLALLLPHDVFVLVLPVGILQLLLLPGISCCLGFSPPGPGRCGLGVLALELLGHPSAGCGRAGASEQGAPTIHSPKLTPVQPAPP